MIATARIASASGGFRSGAGIEPTRIGAGRGSARRRSALRYQKTVRQWLPAALLALLTASAAAEPVGPLGPAPRDARGRFQNLDGPRLEAPLSVRLPFFGRRVFGFRRGAEGAPERVPDALAELAHHSVATATWIGHATVLIR